VSALVLVVVAAAVIIAGAGGPSRARRVAPGHASARRGFDPAHAGTARMLVQRAGSLPAALQDAAAVSLGGARWALLGGLSASDTSTAGIVTFAGLHASGSALLPEAQHDAQAALLGGEVYVFGGGQYSSYDHIVRYEPGSGRVSVVGHLPRPASDVAVTTIGDTACIVGGYDGERALDTILAWRVGQAARLVARLPSGLRYAAVAAIGSKLIIIGGSTEAGASRAILSFDASSGQVTQIGSLPGPLTHASAVSVGPTIFVIGGRGPALGSQTDAILAIDPADGAVRRAGALTQPLSDAALVTVDGQIVLAGGQGAAGTQSAIFELTPAGG
jgi:hypothetical protein